MESVEQDQKGFVRLYYLIEIRHMAYPKLIGLQVTSDSSISGHAHKCLSDPVLDKLILWLQSGNSFELWGWGKKGPRGKKKKWIPRVFEASLLRKPGRIAVELTQVEIPFIV